MKIIKRIAAIVGILLVLTVAAIITIPYLYRDDIKAAVDRQLAASVNADVVYGAENIGISFFRDFPRVTITTGQVGVFNREPFAGEHLIVAEDIAVSINLWDLITGDQIRVSGILLERPDINIRYLADGRANFDIAVPSADTVSTSDSSKFSFGIDHWEIRNGSVTYDDATIPFRMTLNNLQHTGSGDFTEKEFDMKTSSTADSLTVVFDGVEYLTNKKATVDAVLGISEDFSLFTFRDNEARINEFAIGMDGWFRMGETDYQMDIAWKSKDNSFRSVLSLVPGMYSKDFEGIEASGTVDFSGKVKGTFSDTQMPAFDVLLKIADGEFHYPKLPEAVRQVAVDLAVHNADGVIENTSIDLKKFHAEFGKNPVDATLQLANLRTYPLKAAVKASLNLGELTSMFPMEGLTLKGLFSLNAKAEGVYDSIRQIIPALNVHAELANGYAKSADYPFAAEKISALADVTNTSGKMSETSIDVKKLSLVLDGESFEAALRLTNLLDYTWNVSARGGIDLGKALQLFPVEGLTVAGKLKADLQNSGRYSDLEAGRYDKLPASGNASLSNFSMTMKDLPYAVGISQAQLGFDPGKITLSSFQATVGRSDFNATGTVTDYMGYLFGKDVDLKGLLTLRSRQIDLNEFMTESEETAADTAAMGVIPVPQNIHFTMDVAAETVKMMDYTLTGAAGQVILNDGVADLRNVRFNLLGGRFSMTGSYDTRQPTKPLYDFAMKVEDLSIREAASNFSLVQKFAPIAGSATGRFNMDFKLAGALDQQMSPIPATLNAEGLLKIITAGISGSKALSAVSAVTSLKDADQVTLKDVVMSAAIRNGRLSVKPFDVSLGSFRTTVSGSSGLDGSLDYAFKLNVPASAAGGKLSSLLGSPASGGDIPVNIRLGGTFAQPKAELLTAEVKEQVKEEVVSTVKEKGKEALQQTLSGEDPKKVLRNLLGKDSTKTGDSTKAAPKVQKVLEDKLKGLLKKKKN